MEWVRPSDLADRLTTGPARAHTVITAVHGQEPEQAHEGGLDHHVRLDDRHRLRAGDLLTARLAGTLTLGTCFVASASTGPGREPLSLPTAALCAGADAFVSGIFAVPDRLTDDLLAHYYGRLAAGATAHRALRDAQLRHLAGKPMSPPAAWAGLVAIGQPGSSAP